jgi:hypothetical protein
MGQSDILLQPASFNSAYMSHLWTSSLAGNRTLFVEVAGGQVDFSDYNTMHTRLAAMKPVPGAVYTLAMARQMASRHAGRIYIDSPNIIAEHQFVVMRDGEQGVVDTAAEGALLAADAGVDVMSVSSTASVFSAARREGIELLTIRTEADAAQLVGKVAPDVAARIAADVKAGYAVVVPGAPVTVDGRPTSAWWRIDPATGHCLGIGQNGWGEAAVSYGKLVFELVINVGGAVFCFLSAHRCSDCSAAEAGMVKLACFVFGGIGGIGVVGGGATGYFMVGLWSAVALIITGYMTLRTPAKN